MMAREGKRSHISSFPVVEDVIEKKLEEIVTVLGSGKENKLKLYDEVLDMIDRCLIKIAMRRSDNVKSAAAEFLGINRNTLHNKMVKLNIKE